MRILFQGDSITDACSYKKPVEGFNGYVKYTAQALGGDHEYFNHGISGDCTIDVLNRYDTDIKAVKPDIMTLLVGINDIWRSFSAETYTSPETIEKNLREILTKTKQDFPDVKIILLEPFLLPIPFRVYWRGRVAELIDVTRRVAVELADGYIPLDGLFAKEQLVTPWKELADDGIHPVEKGQKMIAKYLVEELKRFI